MQDMDDEQTHFPFYPRQHLKYDIPLCASPLPQDKQKFTGCFRLASSCSSARAGLCLHADHRDDTRE